MFIFKKKYFFIIESIKDIDLKNIKNFGKYSIIYRNNSPENIEILKKFRLKCKIQRIPFFVANNVDLIKALKADGLYISAYNKNLNSSYLKNNFKIIGSAHNLREIRVKETQKVEKIFLSSLFKKNKNYLGINKFKLLSKLTRKEIVVLGGISEENLKKLKILNLFEFAGISYFE